MESNQHYLTVPDRKVSLPQNLLQTPFLSVTLAIVRTLKVKFIKAEAKNSEPILQKDVPKSLIEGFFEHNSLEIVRKKATKDLLSPTSIAQAFTRKDAEQRIATKFLSHIARLSKMTSTIT